MQARDRLIVAADLSSRDEILALADELHGIAGVLKIGLQAFIANGPSLVRELGARGERLFLDLKIHDIPNTVRHAVAEAVSLGATFVTVHASGGAEMLSAAAASQGDATVLAVTLLTSIDAQSMASIGFGGEPDEVVGRLARLAAAAGVRGVVASPHETRTIRELCGEGLVIVTPGVRPRGADAGDQRRVMTPREAIAAGADYIVVGRPVTEAKSRRDAAQRIVDEIGTA